MLLNKRQLFLQFLLFILGPSLAGAEMIAGTVFTVDREHSVFILGLTTQRKIKVYTNISPLPGRVAAGRTVKIWGTYDPENNNFIATDIRGSGRQFHHDPTGARARISSGGHCPNCARYNSPENEKRATEEDYGGYNGHADTR